MDFFPILLCFECGTDNPCRCKVVGPTLGFLGGVMAALVCYPAGLLCCCCDKKTSDKFFGAPIEIRNDISNTLPI